MWKNTKVRDLLDSVFRGFPFGYLMTWKSPDDVNHTTLGGHASGSTVPHALVVDGQQRLTSLYAVMTGHEIVDKKFKKRRIQIAFHPISARFEVADAAIRKNPEWLADVSAVFTDRMGALSVVQSYLTRLEAVREITPEHRRAVETNVSRLVNLSNLPVHVLEIGAEANEEQVAEIFVRINSTGQRLRQADFILTLLAVFWEDARVGLEEFAKACRIPPADDTPAPFNRKLQPDPDALVRVVVAVGHHRARLSAAYQVLRGKDARTGETSAESRRRNLQILASAQADALSVANWHEFLKVLSVAGFRHRKLIGSEVSALFAYSLFLIGRTQRVKAIAIAVARDVADRRARLRSHEDAQPVREVARIVVLANRDRRADGGAPTVEERSGARPVSQFVAPCPLEHQDTRASCTSRSRHLRVSPHRARRRRASTRARGCSQLEVRLDPSPRRGDVQ